MKPWAIVVAIVAGLGIIALLVFDSDDRDFAQRANADTSTRPALQLAVLAGISDPERSISDVIENAELPPEVEETLTEVRDLLATAREQAQAQAQESLERASDRLDSALQRVEDAADDTDNLARKGRLEQVHAALTAIQDQVEAWLDRLEAA
ncbi:MAG TPA: hypothetical protein VFV93_14050 [Thermomicrobiales bacterium]|jgi:hypothetical protein|nr:hypothetical protein [Thermomicrobiales bacterium]